jgi:hypothetical protein
VSNAGASGPGRSARPAPGGAAFDASATSPVTARRRTTDTGSMQLDRGSARHKSAATGRVRSIERLSYSIERLAYSSGPVTSMTASIWKHVSARVSPSTLRTGEPAVTRRSSAPRVWASRRAEQGTYACGRAERYSAEIDNEAIPRCLPQPLVKVFIQQRTGKDIQFTDQTKQARTGPRSASASPGRCARRQPALVADSLRNRCRIYRYRQQEASRYARARTGLAQGRGLRP